MLYMCIEYHIQVNMYHVSAQGVDERMINVHLSYYHYYYYYRPVRHRPLLWKQNEKTDQGSILHQNSLISDFSYDLVHIFNDYTSVEQTLYSEQLSQYWHMDKRTRN